MSEDLLQPAPPPADTTPAPRPADVPEKFWDAETGTLRTEQLLKSYRELERHLAKRVAPPAADAAAEELARFRDAMGIPATPEDYAITAPCPECASHPEVNARLHAAHFSQGQAQLVYDMAADRLLPLIAEAAAEFEANRQRDKLHAHFGGPERFKPIAAQLAAWGRGNLAPPVFAALSTTAEGVLALEQMMRKQEPSLTRDATAPTVQNEDELRNMMRDPRYWRSREPEFVRRVTEGFRRLVAG
jgi:hypothetical protein